MKRTSSPALVTTLLLVTLAAAAPGAAYREVLSWSGITGPGGSLVHYGTIVDSTTAYNFLSLQAPGSTDYGRITKVTDLDAAETYAELLSTAQWNLASGTNSLTGYYGHGFSGDYLQFGEGSTDAVYRVHKSTAAVSQYVTKANITAHTGRTNAAITAAQTVGADGQQYFYDSISDSILQTTAANSVATYITEAQLIATAGNDTVSGGLTFDPADNLYWASNSSQTIYTWNGATGATVLTPAQITAVTNEASAGFGDILYAPDGNIYFYETASDAIMSFDITAPAATLALVCTEAQLLAGPAASAAVGQLTWYDNNIAWNITGTTGIQGFYTIPEPTTLLLLSLATLTTLARRKK